jgi:hypothetical protein
MANALLALALTLYAIGDDGVPAIPVPEAVASDAGETAESPPSQEAYSGTYRFDTLWRPLARCESTERWHIRGRTYSGGLQMDATFWRRYGGLDYAATPADASISEQVAVAERGLAVQGWQAWPYCSRHLGLR